MNSKRPPITICMVARNEEANLAMSLGSVQDWADKILLLDDQSRDNTAEIARSYGAEVRPAPEGFPEAKKNYALASVDTEWAFILDADEVISEESREEIDSLLGSSPDHDAFRMPRLNHYFGEPLRHGGQYPDMQIRLVRAGSVRYPGLGMHERLEIEGTLGVLHKPLLHYPYPDFASWLTKWEWYTRKEAIVLSRGGVPINAASIRHHMVTRPLRRVASRLFVKQGYRDGVPGILAAWIDLMTHVIAFGRYWMAERNLDEIEEEPEKGR